MPNNFEAKIARIREALNERASDSDGEPLRERRLVQDMKVFFFDFSGATFNDCEFPLAPTAVERRVED